MKSSFKNNQGFISIIAIGVFALLMIFAIGLQITVIDTLQNLKNGANYDAAKDISDSTIEYLQWKTQSFSAGLNDTANCNFKGGALDTNSQNLVNPAVCGELSGIIGTKNALVNVSVKGRSATADKLITGKCGAGDCYVVPSPGTGDVGTNCAMYKPNANNSSNVDPSLANGITSLDQANYSCNWNKLTFGSSQTDRVAVPLYYDGGSLSGGSSIVNPYFGAAPLAKKFYVRLRTPCKPCAPSGTSANADQRTCNGTVKDETVCADSDRYVLDASTSDDIVVQWLINGECDAGGGKTEACGMMPVADKVNPSGNPIPYSALYESRIYNNNITQPMGYPTVISNNTDAYDINNYPSTVTIIIPNKDLNATPNKLSQMTKPVFTLFLNKPLLTPSKNNIPYLEYQVLTDYPVGNSKSSLDVTVNVEGNNFHKTLTQEVQKALIDFAIHN